MSYSPHPHLLPPFPPPLPLNPLPPFPTPPSFPLQHLPHPPRPTPIILMEGEAKASPREKGIVASEKS